MGCLKLLNNSKLFAIIDCNKYNPLTIAYKVEDKLLLQGDKPYVTNINYNEKGQRTDIYYGNNSKTKYEYDSLTFRLTRLLTTRNSGNDILQDINYTYDAVGNIVEQTDLAHQTHYFNNSVIDPKGKYQYDALYRLVMAEGRELSYLSMPDSNDFANNIPVPSDADMQNYTQHYTYDEIGNMLELQNTGGSSWTRYYNYDFYTNNYLLSNNEGSFTYDEHGNMISMPHLSGIKWDFADRLRQASNGTFTSYYNYNSSGERSRKVVDKGNIREERYYIGGYEIFRKYVNGSLDTERQTLHVDDDNKKVALVETLTIENGTPCSPSVAEVRYQYDNHLGSACLELDEYADIISYEEYHPFGTTSYRSGRTEVDVSLKRYKYVGKERDEETGLYYYGARYYAAWLCRFVSVDPLQHEYPLYTPYQYAGNKPISYIDLDGLEEAKPEEKKKETYETPEDEKVIKTPESEFLNIPEKANVETFGVKEITTMSGDKIKVDKDATKAFTIGNKRYVAYFEKGKFTGYFLSNDKKVKYEPKEIIYRNKVDENFIKKLLEVSFNLGVDPNKLMAVMAHETGETFKPDIWNGTDAVGLIQFTSINITEINETFETDYTKESISKMTAIEQLTVVEKSFSTPLLKNKKLKTIEDFAVANFAPSYVGKSKETEIEMSNKRYKKNKGLDIDDNGKISIKEVGEKFAAKYKRRKN